MELVLHSLYDSITNTYMQPLCFRSQAESLRAFAHAANDLRSEISKSPSDYHIMNMGSFDDNNGKFTILPTPQRVATASQFVVKKTEETEVQL